MEKKSSGFPNLDKYLNERGRKLVNYKEGAEIYGVPYYSFVRLAKEAGANFTFRNVRHLYRMHDKALRAVRTPKAVT